MVIPGADEVDFDLIVIVLAEIDIDFHDVFEVLCDHGDTDIVLVIDDDVEDLSC